MADVPPVTAMQIANALSKGDSQALAEYGFALLESLAEARARIAAFEERKARDRERKPARNPRIPRKSTPFREIPESPSLSPTPPFTTPTSPSSSSSAREALSWQPATEARLAARLVTDAGRVALAAVLSKCEDKTAVAAEIGMILDGGRPGCSRDPAVMELALADYASNGMSSGRFNAAHFRRHVQKAAEPQTSAPRRGGTGQRSYDNAVKALENMP